MPATNEELEHRLATLESEVGRLREQVTRLTTGRPESLADEMIRRAKESQAALSAAWDKAMRDMGIADVEPIPAEELQQMMLVEGIRPEDNEFSRAIIQAREE